MHTSTILKFVEKSIDIIGFLDNRKMYKIYFS
ncbi:hypothetical protein DFQ12_4233 [Sphingobacterium detergens]|uniref:Uncharacterized protein n=1 Tax=Sphingobacterium detergens TaxID=1145106 RepID=A0A420ARG6_SPHD1|nr:hypothetical protein DFQ12_4233 [Sphingobacterium detergens]